MLRAKEGRLRLIVESLPGGVLLTGPDGTIQAINHAAVTLCKAAVSSSVLGRRLPDIFGVASRERVATLVAEAAGGSRASLDLDLEQGDAAPRLQLRAVPFFREEGQAPSVLLAIAEGHVAPQSDQVSTFTEQVAGLTERIEHERAARTAAEQEHAQAKELAIAAVTEWQVRAENVEKALRNLEQERSALEARLAAAETRLAEAEQDSTGVNAQALDQLAAEIAQRDRALEEARSATEEARRRQEQSERQLDEARSETDGVRTLVSELEQERAVLRSEIAERVQALDDVSRELLSLQAVQAQGEHAREELRVELGRRDEALVLATRQLEELREAHAEELRAAHAATVRATQSEAAAERSRLEAELAQQTGALAEARQQLAALGAAHAETLRGTQSEAAADHSRLEAELAQQTGALAEARQQLEALDAGHAETLRALQTEAAADRSRLDAELAQQTAALAEARQQLEALGAAHAETLRGTQSEAAADQSRLEAELARQTGALAEARQQLEALDAGHAETLRALQTEAAADRSRLDAELAQQTAALAEARQQLEALGAAHAEMLGATQTGAAEDRSRLEAELARLTDAVQEGRHDLDALRQAHAAACAAFLKGKRSQASLEREIGALRAHLDDARVSVERANAEAEQARLARDDWRHRADAAIERTAREELEWQRRAEAALECRPSEELEWTLGVATIGLITTDADGVIERCNDAAARLCGCSDADALHARNRLPRALFDAGALGGEVGPTRRFEAWVQGIDRLPRWVLGVVTPRKNAASGQEHLEWVLVDLSEQYLQERNARLLLGMETLTHFLSSATTECTTLLGQVGETVDSLFDGAPADMPAERIDETRASLMRTRFVLQQLASLARNSERRPVVIDLAQALDQASPLLAGLAGENTPCKVVRPGLTLPAVADPADVDRLLTAIVLSGRECLPAGGRMSLSGRPVLAEVNRHGQTVVQPSLALTLRASGYGVQPVVWQQVSDLAAHLGGRVETKHDAKARRSTIEVVLPSVIRLSHPSSAAGAALPAHAA